MINWTPILAACFGLAIILAVALLVGGFLALIMKLIRLLLINWNASLTDKLDKFLYDCAGKAIDVYLKTAGWGISLVVVLMIIAVGGRLALFGVAHWKDF